MARAFRIQPTAPYPTATTVALGAGNTPNDNLSNADEGKIVKLVGESRYNLTAVGDEIEGFIVAVEQATQNGFTIGSIIDCDKQFVIFDGLQATPGVGVVAVGDYVVAGSPVAKGLKLESAPKVVKATAQGEQKFLWRVVSLGSAGTGAVGTIGVIQRV